MARECRCAIFFGSEKASDRKNGELFRRYTNTLAVSPKQWFRMRDTDGALRFSIGAAIVCNDIEDPWFSNDQLEVLNEIGFILYDAVAFYKHRSEGETHNTFNYIDETLRVKGFWQARELLWALDAAWAYQPERLPVVNILRTFGGPIHMTMRRYRFVEDGLTIGKAETEDVVALTRQHYKLWNRVEASEKSLHQDTTRYEDILSREKILLFPGLAAAMEAGGEGSCDTCLYRTSYGASVLYQFGGVRLCGKCKAVWNEYFDLLPERALKAFPELSTKVVSST